MMVVKKSFVFHNQLINSEVKVKRFNPARVIRNVRRMKWGLRNRDREMKEGFFNWDISYLDF